MVQKFRKMKSNALIHVDLPADFILTVKLLINSGRSKVTGFECQYESLRSVTDPE